MLGQIHWGEEEVLLEVCILLQERGGVSLSESVLHFAETLHVHALCLYVRARGHLAGGFGRVFGQHGSTPWNRDDALSHEAHEKRPLQIHDLYASFANLMLTAVP